MKPDVEVEGRGALTRAAQEVAGVTPLRFVQVDGYPTFLAEYTMDGGDYVVHFFPAKGREGVEYWRNTFPSALDAVARAHFQAKAPRLRAAYTEELNSWWLRASGYGHVVAKDAFIRRFLDRLNQVLERATST